MRLMIKSFSGSNCLVDCKCQSVADVARCVMDFVASQMNNHRNAEFVKFSCVVKREVSSTEIAFDFSPSVIDFD